MSDTNKLKEMEQRVGSTTYKFSNDWIHKLESEDHWRLYWQQQSLLAEVVRKGDSFLEIGVGSGFASNYLRSKGHSVTTYDIDSGKKPDLVGNLVHDKIPGEYDHLIAFEVFEHVPYEEFISTLPKIRKACRVSFCFSVPIARADWIWFDVKLPKLRRWRKTWHRKREDLISDHHFWELQFGDYTLARLHGDMVQGGFRLACKTVKLNRMFLAWNILP